MEDTHNTTTCIDLENMRLSESSDPYRVQVAEVIEKNAKKKVNPNTAKQSAETLSKQKSRVSISEEGTDIDEDGSQEDYTEGLK